MTALHEYNETSVAPQLVNRLLAGKSVALVSDAGTPLLSDPGYRLVNLAIEAKVTVSTIPAPAQLPPLCVWQVGHGPICLRRIFAAERSARITQLEKLQREQRTLVFFESSHRVEDSISGYGPWHLVKIGRRWFAAK